MPLDRTVDTSKPKHERTTEHARDIALRVRKLRMALDITQMDLETRADVSVGSVSRMESGERTYMPSASFVFRLARVLDPIDTAGCVGWLITGQGHWTPPKLPKATLGRLKG